MLLDGCAETIRTRLHRQFRRDHNKLLCRTLGAFEGHLSTPLR
jgi:hypothetical protein